MNIRNIVAIIAFLTLLAAAWWQYGDQVNFPSFSLPRIFSGNYEVEENTTITTKEDGQLAADQHDDASRLAEEFVDLYQEAVADNDEDAANQARDLLSWRGTTVVDQDDSPVAGLQRLSRELPPPDDIQVTGSRLVNQDFAEVTTEWIYPQETLTRYFYIIIEDNHWKIDSIQSIPQ